MFNKESGYGRLVAAALANQGVTALGRLFLVGATTLPNIAFVQQIFKHDATGVSRLYSTVASAVAQCTASAGDVILVLPGHTESIGSATALQLNVAGITVLGLGSGNLRPTFTFTTATTATIAVSAANVSVKNCIFDLTGFDAVVAGFTVSAAGFTFSGNKVILTGATNQAVAGIVTTAAANDLTVSGNTFDGTADAGTTCAITIVGGNAAKIVDNVFQGGYSASVGAIQNITTACTNAVIKGNLINNLTASSTKAAVFVSTSTGFVSDNRIQILSGTAPITGAAMSWVGGNYYAATIATGGTLI